MTDKTSAPEAVQPGQQAQCDGFTMTDLFKALAIATAYGEPSFAAKVRAQIAHRARTELHPTEEELASEHARVMQERAMLLACRQSLQADLPKLDEDEAAQAIAGFNASAGYLDARITALNSLAARSALSALVSFCTSNDASPLKH